MRLAGVLKTGEKLVHSQAVARSNFANTSSTRKRVHRPLKKIHHAALHPTIKKEGRAVSSTTLKLLSHGLHKLDLEHGRLTESPTSRDP